MQLEPFGFGDIFVSFGGQKSPNYESYNSAMVDADPLTHLILIQDNPKTWVGLVSFAPRKQPKQSKFQLLRLYIQV